MKIEIIKKYLLILCVTLIILSVMTALINEKISRISFFIACYISIIGILINKKNYCSFIKSIPVALLILGLSKFIWFYYFRIYTDIIPEIDMYSGYIQSGKRIILCSLLISYLLINIKNTDYSKLFYPLFISLFLSFIFGTAFALYQINIGLNRIDLFTVATSAAYMYSCLTLVLISLLIKSNIRNLTSYIVSIVIFLISLFVISKTGTRAALIFHPVIFFIIILFTNWKNKYRTAILLTSAATIAIFFFSFSSTIIDKINQTNSEILVYKNSQGNIQSSLGDRFSMWNTGIHSFLQRPMGAMMKQRHQIIEEYTEQTNKYKSALEFTYIHLHNELIDTLSLQGILGALALLFFYCTMLYKSIMGKNPMLLSVTLCLLIYGLTDVILINRAMSLLFCLMIIVSLLLNKQQNIEKQVP